MIIVQKTLTDDNLTVVQRLGRWENQLYFNVLARGFYIRRIWQAGKLVFCAISRNRFIFKGLLSSVMDTNINFYFYLYDEFNFFPVNNKTFPSRGR
jgi:hypothetical protein